ncbi:MAG: CoA transferase, partial [Bacteroidota bacterium]
MSAPLSGFRVIELAGVLAGPSAGQLFAELGADVIKVEPPGGDVTRTWRLPSEASGETTDRNDRPAYFSAANWGKRSVALDLGQPGGREALHLLVRGADVVLTAYRPGSAERLGADAATLRALSPRLVVAELTGYGPDNPRAGYDAVIQAESGFMHLNGPTEGAAPEASGESGPTKMPVALMDLLAAHQIKEGVLAALLRRERTGEGATVQVSLTAAAAGALANQGTAWLQAG